MHKQRKGEMCGLSWRRSAGPTSQRVSSQEDLLSSNERAIVGGLQRYYCDRYHRHHRHTICHHYTKQWAKHWINYTWRQVWHGRT